MTKWNVLSYFGIMFTASLMRVCRVSSGDIWWPCGSSLEVNRWSKRCHWTSSGPWKHSSLKIIRCIFLWAVLPVCSHFVVLPFVLLRHWNYSFGLSTQNKSILAFQLWGFHKCRLTTQYLFAVMQLYFHLTQPCQGKIEYQTSRRLVFIATSPNAKSHQSNRSHWLLWRLYQIDHFIFYICKIIFGIQQDSHKNHKHSFCVGRERLPPSASPSK